MYPKIKNFITTKYYKKKLEDKNGFYQYADEDFLKKWNDLHEKLHRHLQYQLKCLYPEAHLHVITNEYFQNNKKVTYHKFDFEGNHLIKLFMYDLIPEPAMYLDSDILLFRRFKDHELPNTYDFNLYNASMINFEKMIPVKLPIQIKKLYNAGVVYISNPNKKLTNNLFEIYEKYFKIKNCNITDETCISFFIEQQKINMFESNEINISKSMCMKDFFKKQSVHYIGFYLQHKLMYFDDFKYSPTYKNFKNILY